MKRTYCLALVPFLLLTGCLDASKLDEKKSAAQEAISAEGQASTNIYLDDMNESQIVADAAPATTPDPSVTNDTKEARIKAMATKVMDRLDANDDGSLTKDEFLALAKPMDAAKAAQQTSEKIAAKQKKLEEQFVKAAGTDNLISVAELETSLKAQGLRIGKFRSEHHKGEHKERVKKVTAEVLAKFDLNKDGKLDEAEYAALRAQDKAECKKNKGGMGEGKGGMGEGKGGMAGTDGNSGRGKGGMPGVPGTDGNTAPGKGTTAVPPAAPTPPVVVIGPK